MNAEQRRRDELADLGWSVTKLRWRAAEISPAAEEMLKAIERVLREEITNAK